MVRVPFPPEVYTAPLVVRDENWIVPEETRPVAPEITPAFEISIFVVSRANVPDPPPIETSAFDVPVFIFVAKLELVTA